MGDFWYEVLTREGTLLGITLAILGVPYAILVGGQSVVEWWRKRSRRVHIAASGFVATVLVVASVVGYLIFPSHPAGTLATTSCAPAAAATAQASETPVPHVGEFDVYTEAGAPGNHYVPSGYEGDVATIALTENCGSNPHSGQTCIQAVYAASLAQSHGFAGVVWQDPAGNWGTMPGGYDLTAFPHLSFWVRGERGGEKITFGMGGIQGPAGDSLRTAATTGVVTLTTSWQHVALDLTGYDISHIVSGFYWTATKSNNPQGAIFYLDDVIYSAT